ncbi:SusC/RagA family TonB-linked outer membrane protein [Flavobacterium aquicola]|uniref:TonB-linked SusC/RagA family outer membrane protein n=1 Tax=Flavobacterium aquicola TaxID=1682742 RepID=A0A3E0EK13_9FLAO|nr:TonB-dependent receptor [Flavobacterium aquicola]REG98080.1 TonB-linked SusC/RagA family outer membrane protein [Flavobacterium aquicola]
MKLTRLFIFCVSSLLFTVIMQAQDITINGKVNDEKGMPIPGASILIKGTATAASSDFDGKFEIKAPSDGTLTISFIGYGTSNVQIDGRTQITVQLKSESQNLNEVVVVGYGTQKKSVVTGAISSIKADQLSHLSVGNTAQALQGQTAGVTVLPQSGAPGAGTKIRIRGAGSNGNSDPIYVVDGMRTSNIDYLDPNDIEKIEILKDAASAAIYGADGGNGVVMVTTKKGKAGSMNVSFSTQFGFQSLRTKLDMMDANEYVHWINETNPSGAHPSVTEWSGKRGTNWVDEAAEDAAPMSHTTLQISGGNEVSTFMLSGNFFTQDGLFGGDKTNFNRTTVRFNSNHKISKYLEAGENFSYSVNKRKAFTEDDSFNGVMNHAMLLDPTTPVYYPSGSTLPAHVQTYLTDNRPLIKNGNGEYYGLSQYVQGEIANPVGQIAIDNGQNVETKIIGNVYANIKPISGLVITTRYGIEQRFTNFEDWNPKYWWNSQKQTDTNTKTFNHSEFKTWLWENFATYSKTIDKHEFSGMLGMSAQETESSYLNTTTSGMIKEGDTWAQVGETPVKGTVAGNKYPTSMNSYFGRVTYSYDNRYLFQASLRNDNSSLFAPDKRAGYFPAVSAGWVISNEAFWKVEAINQLKFRASWGQNGSTSNISAGQWNALITKDGLKYPDALGNYLPVGELKVLPNENITWETTEQTDFGFDVRALENRLTLGFDYYNKVTKDLLTPSSPPPSIGQLPPYANAGDVTNKGIEIELGWREQKKDFGYGINFNFTTMKNEVTYLNPLLDRVNGAEIPTLGTVTVFELGQPVWYFRGYKTDGIYQNQAQIDAYKASLGHVTTYSPVPGDPIVVDANGDGDINSSDKTYIGSPHPDFMIASTIDLDYKGFDFKLFLQGAFGGENFMALSRTDLSYTNRPSFFYNDRWTKEGSTNSFPRASTSDPYTYSSDLMVQDASYVKIKQIQLGYNFKSGLIKQLGMTSLRFYLSLDDWFTFTKYKGIDPEVGSFNNNSQGIDRGLYPTASRFMTGLSATF